MIDPEPCSVPRCKEHSLFSTLGLVGGRFFPQCHQHALAHVGRELAHWQAVMDSLTEAGAELPGQEALPI